MAIRTRVRFTLAKMKGNTLDFSFSGMKTAVLRWVEARDMAEEIARAESAAGRQRQASVEDWLRVTPKATLDLLASFQATVIDELLRRATRAAEEIGARSLIISGGVACNSGLRRAAEEAQSAVSGLLSWPWAIDRQCRDDRGGGVSEADAG